MRQLPTLFTALLFASTLTAQTPRPQASQTTDTLHTSTQLVVVDVLVQDSHGQPIHGLKAEDFVLTEGHDTQSIRHFEEHTKSTAPVAAPPMPKFPAGTFTNYTPDPPAGALNVVLIDTLNTAIPEQAYVRDQMQRYVKRSNPGARTAIFGLSRSLYILQSFTSDPEILKAAAEHKLTPNLSSLLTDPTAQNPDIVVTNATMAAMGTAANLAAMEQSGEASQSENRTRVTLAAFNELAHYLSNFPSRKNLIWFSGSFPLDPSDPNLTINSIDDREYRETINLLSRAQVAVYPVDAHGLNPATGTDYTQGGMLADRLKASMAASTAQGTLMTTMRDIAEETGGKPYFNTNDLASSVSEIIEAGSNYYSLIYSPSNKNWNGDYRRIRVALSPSSQAGNSKLSYRQGYYADDAHTNIAATSSTPDAAATPASGGAYARAALARGAPNPTDILFRVQVLPVSKSTDNKLAPENKLDPKSPIKPPFRRFAVSFAALAGDFKLTLDSTTGRRTGALEFKALLYNANGELLNENTNAVSLNLTPDAYKKFLTGVGAQMEISVPVKGQTFLRLIVHDIAANRFGAVELATSELSKLEPSPTPATK